MTPIPPPTRALVWILLAAAPFVTAPDRVSTPDRAAAPDTSEVALDFAPGAGTVRSTAVVLIHEVDGGALTVVMDDQEVPAIYLPELDMRYHDERAFTVEEAFPAGGAGGGSGWLRHYVSIAHANEGSFTMAMPNQEPMEMPWEFDQESELAGAVLRIEAEGGELACEVVEGGSPPEGLRLDLSFAAFLPAEPVAVGGSWRMEGEALALLLEPGGDLGVILDPQAREHLFPEFDSVEHRGELILTLVAHEDGRARVELEGQLIRTSVRPGDLSHVPVIDGDATDTTSETYELGGELIWDTAARALAELDLGGRFESDTLTVRDPDLPGSTYESHFSFEGEWSLAVTCAPAESRVLEAAAAR